MNTCLIILKQEEIFARGMQKRINYITAKSYNLIMSLSTDLKGIDTVNTVQSSVIQVLTPLIVK